MNHYGKPEEKFLLAFGWLMIGLIVAYLAGWLDHKSPPSRPALLTPAPTNWRPLLPAPPGLKAGLGRISS